MEEHLGLFFLAAGNGVCRKPTEHADEEGLVDQLVALWIDHVELEGQAASFLSSLVAELQQACETRDMSSTSAYSPTL